MANQSDVGWPLRFVLRVTERVDVATSPQLRDFARFFYKRRKKLPQPWRFVSRSNVTVITDRQVADRTTFSYPNNEFRNVRLIESPFTQRYAGVKPAVSCTVSDTG